MRRWMSSPNWRSSKDRHGESSAAVKPKTAKQMDRNKHTFPSSQRTNHSIADTIIKPAVSVFITLHNNKDPPTHAAAPSSPDPKHTPRKPSSFPKQPSDKLSQSGPKPNGSAHALLPSRLKSTLQRQASQLIDFINGPKPSVAGRLAGRRYVRLLCATMCPSFDPSGWLVWRS